MDFLPEGVAFNKNITYLAKTNFRKNEQTFGIKRKDRRQHMYVLGKSGSGKSALLGNMIVQNIWNGEGVCVVDPHGELVESILSTIPAHRVKDVIYFNPADTEYHIGFNVLQIDDPKYKHLVASGLMGIFTKIWANAWSARMEYILNNAILALADTPGSTLLGIPRLLVDKDYRQVVISNLKDPVIKAFWVHEYETWRDQYRNEAIAPIQNKVGQFLSTSIVRNVVGQAKSTIDMFDMMNSGKIFLVNVSKGRIGEDNSALLGGMLITKLQLAAMERVRIPEDDRKDFYLYVDEFQNFVTDSFASILSEARKYRLNLTLAHQYIAQLVTKDSEAVRDAVFGNVGTMIIFRVGAADAEFLEPEFSPEFTIEDLVNLPNYTIYLKLMVDGVTSRPFSAKTLPPFKIPADSNVGQEIIESSRKLYARPRDTVEKEINDWSGMLVGLGQEGKFKATCSSCGKETMVPFEPEEGRPVYCKDCIAKIKSGEMKPIKGTRSSSLRPQSYDALASLGIEFAEEGSSKVGRFVTPPVEHKAPQKKMNFALQSYKSKLFGGKPDVKKPNPVEQSRPTETQTTQEVQKESMPVARVRNMRPPKERTSPDHAGLQNILKEALGDVINKNIKIGGEEEKKEGTENVEKKQVVEKKETISLSSLKKPEPLSESSQQVKPKLFTKEASTQKVSALADAIAKARKQPVPDVVPPNTASETVTPTPEVVHHIPVHEAPEVQEVKKEEIKKEIPRESSEKTPTPNNEPKVKEIKEVPENVLRDILQE